MKCKMSMEMQNALDRFIVVAATVYKLPSSGFINVDYPNLGHLHSWSMNNAYQELNISCI